jgi:hypothetical protein
MNAAVGYPGNGDIDSFVPFAGFVGRNGNSLLFRY